MAKSKPPRKKYVPKGVCPPVTQGLIDELARTLRFGIMSLELGTPSAEAWKEVGKVLFTISMASDDADVDKVDKIAVDSSVLTLKHISDRQVRTGVWSVNSIELDGLIRGANAAERLLGRLKYSQIAKGYRAFRILTRTI